MGRVKHWRAQRTTPDSMPQRKRRSAVFFGGRIPAPARSASATALGTRIAATVLSASSIVPPSDHTWMVMKWAAAVFPVASMLAAVLAPRMNTAFIARVRICTASPAPMRETRVLESGMRNILPGAVSFRVRISRRYHPAEIKSATHVAMPAPTRPIPNLKMRTGSRITRIRFDPKATWRGVTVSTSPRNVEKPTVTIICGIIVRPRIMR
mmetsp:Transcript_23084/g.55177  ORF Transcript_23084/g.55177 Transcript_23084/m.55177 type:complete len:210 (-) Transcript_23084:745-1374(-)